MKSSSAKKIIWIHHTVVGFLYQWDPSIATPIDEVCEPQEVLYLEIKLFWLHYLIACKIFYQTSLFYTLGINWKIPLTCHISCVEGITGSVSVSYSQLDAGCSPRISCEDCIIGSGLSPKVSRMQVVTKKKGFVNCFSGMLEWFMSTRK